MEPRGAGKWKRERRTDASPVASAHVAKQAEEATTLRKRRSVVKVSVWTDRLLVASEQGVKGCVWHWPNVFFEAVGFFSINPDCRPISPRCGEPLTGEPDAVDPLVRFGGRGGWRNSLPYPDSPKRC